MERYYSFPDYCRNTFGRKLYRIALDAGMTCPNRDGTLSYGGCIFCDEGGSGDFALKYDGQSIDTESIPYLKDKGKPGDYIAYFQAYTNTYAPLERLRMLYTAALSDPAFAGISIATRPDCLGKEVLSLLAEMKQSFPGKFLWVELGLQTMHEETARLINRGYEDNVFEEAVNHLHSLGIPVIAHVILGLPGEDETMMYETVQYCNDCRIDGIKLQLLHVLKNTRLSDMYHAGKLHVLREEEYIHVLCGCIARLDEHIVIHRLTGDGNPLILEAPLWSRDKKHVLNEIRHAMKEENIRQGCLKEK